MESLNFETGLIEAVPQHLLYIINTGNLPLRCRLLSKAKDTTEVSAASALLTVSCPTRRTRIRQ